MASGSLLLCAGVCVLWIRSYSLTDRVVWQRAGSISYVRSAEGHIVLDLGLDTRPAGSEVVSGLNYERDRAESPDLEMWLLSLNNVGEIRWRGRGGFAWHTQRKLVDAKLARVLVAPFWSVAL